MVVLDYIWNYIELLPLFVVTLLFSLSHNSHPRIMALFYFQIYLFSCLIITLLTSIFTVYKWDNLYISHFYFILQFILLSLFYYEFFDQSQRLLIKYVSIIIAVILSIQYIFTPHLFFSFNLLEVFLTSFPLVVYSIIHLNNSLSGNGEFLYINAAVLIYLSASTLIFILGNFLATFEKEFIRNIWIILKVLYIVYLIFIFLEWKNNLAPYKAKKI